MRVRTRLYGSIKIEKTSLQKTFVEEVTFPPHLVDLSKEGPLYDLAWSPVINSLSDVGTWRYSIGPGLPAVACEQGAELLACHMGLRAEGWCYHLCFALSISRWLLELFGSNVPWKGLAYIISRWISRTILSIKVFILRVYLLEIVTVSSLGVLKQNSPHDAHLKNHNGVHSQSPCPS